MSDDLSKKLVQIAVNTGKDSFFYKGYMLNETQEFILFQDKKIGEVRIYKCSIISISELGGNNIDLS